MSNDKKICSKCAKTFTPAKSYYHYCVDCLTRKVFHSVIGKEVSDLRKEVFRTLED